MWNVWAHEYLAILVGCQLFTAYWLSAIIWSRFVNETHEYLINSFIDHGGLTVMHLHKGNFIRSAESRNHANGLPYRKVSAVNVSLSIKEQK